MSAAAILIYHAATLVRGEHRLFGYLKELRRVQRMTPPEVRQRQAEKLRRMLAEASASVPHYRGLPTPPSSDPEVVMSTLAQWPLLEKAVLQSSPERLRNPAHARVAAKSTGGSTGAAVRILKDPDGLARERAVSWMAYGWFGVSVGDRVMRFWGTPLTAARRRAYLLADLAMNRRRLSAFEFEDRDLARHWKAVERFRPRWLYGYATTIHLMARWLLEAGIDGRSAGIRLIVPTAEPLSAEMKRDIEQAFGAPVQDEYGCGEVGAIAYQCPGGSFHVMTENVAVEILREDGTRAGPGEAGEVVVTDLTNRAMPLIRYRLGDRSEHASPCSCGLPFPTLGAVHGRARDMIVTPTGRRIYGGQVHYHMSAMSEGGKVYRQYQFVQRTPTSALIRLVTDGPIPPEVEQRLASFAKQQLDGMELRLERVERIERAPSGKLQLVKNEWLGAAGPERAKATTTGASHP